MIRKLAFALSFLGAGFTSLVYALGLGEATVQSALNQPLNAEIELVNVGDLEAAEILPGLATREEFLKAGVDRVYFLSDIRFKVAQGNNGEPVVVLTTTKPVREPYLNFLVEVIWPSGRLLREYALLIDPPVFAEDEPAVVAAPAPTPAQPVASRPAGDRVAIPVQSVTATPTSIQGGTYGPTNSRDTLWEIAMKARPDRSVSPQQVMLAIQDLNPDAFIDNNINKLKAGQVLRLPSKADMQRRSTAQAINEVIAQNEALQPRKRKAIVSAEKTSATTQKSASGPSLSSGDELKLVVAEAEDDTASTSAGQGGGTSGAGGDVAAEKELAITLEKLDKASIENKELNSRVGDLEEQLETLQRLLTLKNDQLASIQEQMRENEMARLQAEAEQQEVAASPDASEDMSGMQDADMADATSADALSADTGAEEAAPQAGEEQVADSAEKPADAVVPAPDTKQTSQPPVTPAAPQKTQNFIEMILANPLYMALAGLGVLILLVLLWLLSRHNAQQERALQEQLAAEDEDADDSVASVFDTQDEPIQDEASHVDEEALYPEEEMDAASLSDEAEQASPEQEDVIAEADVYIAYGRLDQAATILEEAISREPVRTDYRLKLLEVYKESGNTEAFDRQFSELEAIQDADALEEAQQIRAESVEQDLEEIDHKELELSDDVADDVPLQTMETEDAAIASEEEALLSEDPAIESEPDNSFDLDTVEEAAELEDAELDVDLSSEELDLDVDVDIDLEQAELSTSDAVIEEVDEVDDAELDAAIDQIDQELSEDLDLELDDIDLSDELDKESEIELPEDLSIPDELTAVDEPLEDDAEVAEAVEQIETEVPEAPDTVVSDDILEEAVEALGDPDSFEPELGEGDDFDFLEGTDEASTKLDLARAYIDMGDVDGAKDILQEVESEGSPEQQAEAKELLDSLGG